MILSSNAEEVAIKRYFMEGEDWEKCCLRVGTSIAQGEQDNRKWADKFSELIFDGDFIPGGRILRNSGRARGSLLNCYCISLPDSILGIGQCIKDSLTLWASGGGVGINASSLRPKGAPIRGKGGFSSGLVSFIKAINAVARTIESGGQRRAAAIAIVDVKHPEVLDFIDAKLVRGELECFNISVSITEEFLVAVENDEMWEFEFEGKKFGSEKARTIWCKILKNMISSAEPGLINFDNLRKNNSYYFAPVIATNPCGEVPLDPENACCLGSLTLSHFISGSQTNWVKLATAIETAVRFLDNVLDCNKFEITSVEQSVRRSRRIGLGTMGLADYLFAKGVRYGSDKAMYEIDRLYKFIRDKAYEVSIKLAVEKGTFPAYEKMQYSKASFIRRLPASIRMDIKQYGIRNCTIISQAPTGTISLLPESTSGIEPLFAKALITNDRVGKRVYIHPIYASLLKENKEIPEWLVDSYDITPQEHFKTQVAVQALSDSAVSKCVSSGTRVSTSLGLMKISDLSSNREKDTFSDINLDVLSENSLKKANKFYYNGIEENGYCIESNNGFIIKGTPTHKIRCLSDDHKMIWKSLKEITYDDVLITKLNSCIVNTTITRSISTILGKEFLQERRAIKSITLPKLISRDLMWWLGCLFSDGGVAEKTNLISLTQIYGKVLDKFISVTKNIFGVDCTLTKDIRRDNLYGASISSSKLYDWLVKYIGFNKNSIPELIFRSGKLMIQSFLEGITLDGFVCKDSKKVCIKTDKTLNVIRDLQLLCSHIGIPTYICPNYSKEYDKNYYNLFVEADGIITLNSFNFSEEHKKNNLKILLGKNKYPTRTSFMFSSGKIPVNDSFIITLRELESKCKYSTNLLSIFHHIANYASKNKYLTLDSILTVYTFLGTIPEVFNSNLLFSNVKSISKCSIETMDIEVVDTHSYIANGFLSHNTANLPRGSTPEELDKLLLEYIRDLKGVTVYVDGCRGEQPLNRLTEEEAKLHLNQSTSSQSEQAVQCSSGKCEL